MLAVRPGQQARVSPLTGGEGDATACYDDPAAAAAVLGKLVPYQAWLCRPVGEHPGFPEIDTDALARLVRSRLGAGPGWLVPADAAEILRLVGIPMVETRYTTDEAAALTGLHELGGPIVVKVDATGLLHKSAGGGVVLDVTDAAGVHTAMRDLRHRFGAALRGVVLQPMVAPGRELLIGLRSDTVFGPLVVFGLGGVDTDLLADHAARLAPLTDTDADLLMDGLRSSTALWSPSLDRAAVRDLLLRVSRLAELVPEIAELDLNPVRVTVTGCLALDVRVRLEPREPTDLFPRHLRS